MGKLINILFLYLGLSLLLSSCRFSTSEKKTISSILSEELEQVENVENDHFRIQFPGKISYFVDTVLSMHGEVLEHKYIFEKSVAEVYMLSYFHWSIPPAEIEKRMYAASDEILTYFSAEFRDKKFVDTDKGRFFYFTAMNSDVFLNFQLVYHNGIFYQMGILMPFTYRINEGYSPFLNSFQLK